MNTDVKDSDRMSIDEIKYRHNVRGVSVRVLAQLNACSVVTINRILSGKKASWTPESQNHIVVNVDEGRFYPSINECERQEGIKKGVLSASFHKRGPRIVFKGTRYHKY